jgi:hypothetical protein
MLDVILTPLQSMLGQLVIGRDIIFNIESKGNPEHIKQLKN